MSEHPTNLDYQWHGRTLPNTVGKRQLLTVVGILVILLTGMEIKARQDNYPVNFPFTADMWAKQWHRLKPQQTVFIGASRMQFGMIINEWEQQLDARPLLLAWPGQSPAPVLTELANNDSFSGTVLCGVAPSFTFIAQHVPWQNWMKNNLKGAEIGEVSLSYHMSVTAHGYLRPHVKCLNDAAYSPVANSYFGFPIPDRKNVLPPIMFRFNATRDDDNQMRFLDVIETSKDRQDLILARMETGRRRMLHFGPAPIDSLLGQFTSDVKKIQSRGGQVIFIRPPSNGVFRQFEHDNYPRTKYWDKLIEATGCHGVHFEDHPELEELVCVEESHLSKSDAVLFTQRVINILVNNGIIERMQNQSGDSSPAGQGL